MKKHISTRKTLSYIALTIFPLLSFGSEKKQIPIVRNDLIARITIALKTYEGIYYSLRGDGKVKAVVPIKIIDPCSIQNIVTREIDKDNKQRQWFPDNTLPLSLFQKKINNSIHSTLQVGDATSANG